MLDLWHFKCTYRLFFNYLRKSSCVEVSGGASFSQHEQGILMLLLHEIQSVFASNSSFVQLQRDQQRTDVLDTLLMGAFSFLISSSFMYNTSTLFPWSFFVFFFNHNNSRCCGIVVRHFKLKSYGQRETVTRKSICFLLLSSG